MTTLEPATPTHIAGYAIERVLATGGMSTIYLVRDPTLPQWDVLKVLSADLARDAALRARFLHEAGITAGLHHPNVVSVYGRGETDDGHVWIAMQYVDGTDAEAALQAGAMTPARAIRIITEVARALDLAHRCGVVHQDIKPSNVLLGEQRGERERVVLTDFGIALTPHSADPGPMLATLAYSAPEVITGATVDGRADVYALGCSLFRLLTAQYPFPTQDDLSATINAHLNQPPPRLSDHLPWATPELDTVIATALAKDPSQRYRTAGEFATAANRALAAAHPATPVAGHRPRPPDAAPPGPTSPTSHPTADTPASEFGTRAVDFIGHLPRTQPVAANRRLLAVAGLVAAVAVAVIALVVWLVLPSQESPHTPATTTSDSPTPDPAATAALTAALPPGYAASSCTPTATSSDLAAATLSCGPAPGPGSPPVATYTLARDRAALQGLFNRATATATTVVCPGNIQSPGPWHRVANPTVAVGTVFCGLADGRPMVSWTTEDKLLVATIGAQAPDNPTLEQLYTWWASHS